MILACWNSTGKQRLLHLSIAEQSLACSLGTQKELANKHSTIASSSW